MMAAPELALPMRYEFLVDEELVDRALTAFPEFTVAPNQYGFTALHGPVSNYIHLRGVLARFDTLGLTVVEMRRLPD